MGEALIIQKSTRFSATIEVTYSGGTCTCALEDETYTHSGGGTVTFIVKKKGIWIIQVTDRNGILYNNTVYISEQNEVKTITINHTLYVTNGQAISTVAGLIKPIGVKTNSYETAIAPLINYGTNYITIQTNTNADGRPGSAAYFTNAIDLTDYNSLIINGSGKGDNSGSWCNMFISSTKPVSGGGFTSTATLRLTSGKTATTISGASLSTSTLKGKYYIGFHLYNDGYLNVNNLRLE